MLKERDGTYSGYKAIVSAASLSVFYVWLLATLFISAAILSPQYCQAKSSAAKKTKKKQGKEASIISSRYKVIVNKDPFDKDRGGADTGKDGEPEAPAEGISENYELYGIIRTGKLRKAFLKERHAKKTRIKWNRKKKRPSRPKFRIVVEGDLIDGWTVKEITPTGIVLSGNNKTVKMDVFSSQKTNRKATRPVAMQTKPDIPPAVKSPAITASQAKKAAKPTKTTTPALSPKPASLQKVGGNIPPPAPNIPKPQKNRFKRVLKTSTSTGIKTPPAETPDDEAILSPEDITVPPLNLPGK